MTKHIYVRHENCQLDRRCAICDGGLAVCEICKAAEGELTTDCPGSYVDPLTRNSVYQGRLDFVNGAWVEIKGDI